MGPSGRLPGEAEADATGIGGPQPAQPYLPSSGLPWACSAMTHTSQHLWAPQAPGGLTTPSVPVAAVGGDQAPLLPSFGLCSMSPRSLTSQPHACD